LEVLTVKMIFETTYSIGDRVKIKKGEHNDNWAGKVGKIVEIGIDLSQVAYIVKFKNEMYQPCFLREDLKPVYRKNNADHKIIFDTKFKIGDKVKVLPNVKSLKTSLFSENNKPWNIYIDNHMTLEQINYCYKNKIGFCSPEEYHWFNNMVYYLNLTENETELWKDKVGEIIEIEIDGTEKSHKIIYNVKYFKDKGKAIKEIPCFLESDLELSEDLS